MLFKNLLKSKFTKVGLVISAAFIGLSAAFIPKPQPPFEITNATPLWQVMTRLGKINPHTPKDPNNKSLVAIGESLVQNGWAYYEGSKSSKLSPKFTCASCHISKPEHTNLHNTDPEERLRYAETNDIPFLPGPSFYGMVNRIMFFNDDLLKSFVANNSDLLKAAHFNLRDAVDACNQVFAHGRKMKDWEKEAILMYLWTMELKMGDLKMPSKELDMVKTAVETNRSNAKAVNTMRNYYLEVYPAHLEGPADPVERRMISPVVSNFAKGRNLYEHSCLHCHEGKRYSNMNLDYKQKTFKKLRDNFESQNLSIYEAHRYVNAGKSKKVQPIFTAERMNNTQLQDLRYFIQTMARMGDEALKFYGDNK